MQTTESHSQQAYRFWQKLNFEFLLKHIIQKKDFLFITIELIKHWLTFITLTSQSWFSLLS